MIRAARDADFAFLRALSIGPTDEQLSAQIRQGRLRIIESDENSEGFLKFCILWEILPFIEVIVVREECRGRGFGRRAVRAWEQEMAGRSFSRVIVSTQANETAQEFWRKIGYRDCGSLTLPGKPVELFMYRDLTEAAS
jgi:ribosomal protein S18 acetylase RimI-like enzyme